MNRFLLLTIVSLITISKANAHFVFIVPESNGASARIILSEDLKPDEDVKIGIIADAKLLCRESPEKQTPLTLEKADDHALVAKLPGNGTRLIHGEVPLGVKQKGDAPAYLLTYHPKTIVGDAFDTKASLGNQTPLEIVPIGKPGDLKFKVLNKNKPAADAEVNLVLPDGSNKKVKTDQDGCTPSFKEIGRFGAWSRYFETTSGQYADKKFEQIRHYATLVIDVLPTSAPTTRFSTMPEPSSSFGAVGSDGWLYVYGGHIAPTHTYSTQAVSGRFTRMKLDDGSKWEDLPSGPALQGMNLVAHAGKIYRVGGMQPKNKPGDKAENYSVADCARFNPATRPWETIAPMPEPRSSHDVVVIGDKLLVLGGWTLKGKEPTDWPQTSLVMDLSSPDPKWKSIPQPFQLRALIAAVHEGKIYVMGGFNKEQDPVQTVQIYDPSLDTWTTGPELPGHERNGFAPAACAVGGKLYVSVADGTLYQLNPTAKSWEKVATATPRIVHRLIPVGSQILIVGGAAKGDNLDLIEAVQLDQSPTIPPQKPSQNR